MKDKLFTSTPKKYESAVAGGAYCESYVYIEGYYRTSELIVLSILNNKNKFHQMQFLFLPLMFNYRHYVELHLKHLIKQAEKLYFALKIMGGTRGELNESVISQLTKTHGLETLLEWLKGRIKLVTDETLDEKLLKTIRQLNEVDSDGQNFRYSVRTNCKKSLPNQFSADIEKICSRMQDIHNYLSGIDIWLDEEIRSVYEFLYECQEEKEILNCCIKDYMDESHNCSSDVDIWLDEEIRSAYNFLYKFQESIQDY